MMTNTAHSAFADVYAPPRADAPAAELVPSELARPQIESAVRSLGTTALVLGVLDLGYSLLKLANSMVSLAFMQNMSRPASGVGADMLRMAGEVALLEGMRMLPFIGLSITMIAIGRQLQKLQPRSLTRAHRWTGFAFGGLAISLGLGLLAQLRMSEAFTRELGADSWFTLAMLAGPILGAAVMAIWPVVLRRKVSRLSMRLAML